MCQVDVKTAPGHDRSLTDPALRVICAPPAFSVGRRQDLEMQTSSNLLTHLSSPHRCSCVCAGLGDWPEFSDLLSAKKNNPGLLFPHIIFQ